MKALSIRQPWAWLIANGHKDIENRTWHTNFRREFLIHASKKVDKHGYKWVQYNFPDIKLPNINGFELGAIVGQAKLAGCVTRSDSKWFEGNFGFLIKDAKPLPPIPCKGRLGFFEVEDV